MRNSRFLIVAAVLAGGIAVSFLFGQLGHPFGSTATRALAMPLDEFPVAFGEWKGEDQELGGGGKSAEKVKEIAGMDRYLLRIYRSKSGDEVSFYVSYYGNRQRGLRTIYHNPTVCLPAAGWKKAGSEVATVRLSSPVEREVRLSLHRFERLGQTALVGSFVILDGEVLAEPPRERPLRLALAKLKLRFDPGYYVQVQVVPRGSRSGDTARRTALRFLADALPHLFRHF